MTTATIPGEPHKYVLVRVQVLVQLVVLTIRVLALVQYCSSTYLGVLVATRTGSTTTISTAACQRRMSTYFELGCTAVPQEQVQLPYCPVRTRVPVPPQQRRTPREGDGCFLTFVCCRRLAPISIGSTMTIPPTPRGIAYSTYEYLYSAARVLTTCTGTALYEYFCAASQHSGDGTKKYKKNVSLSRCMPI